MKKYPVTWLLLITVVCIFGGITAWRYTEYFFGKSNWQTILFPILIGGTSLLWLTVMLLSLTKTKLGKRLGKLWKTEEKNRTNKFKQTVVSGKEIVLVVKRRIFANVSFVFGLPFIWVVLLLIPNLSVTEQLILIPLSLIWCLYGFIFSFFFYKKFIVFNGKNFIINQSGNLMVLNVNEIKTVKPIINEKYKKAHPSKTLSILMLADVEVELINGQKLIFTKADKVWNYSYKIKVIQKMCENK